LVCESLLARGAGYSSEDLAAMSLDDQRNALIVENQRWLGGATADFQALSTYENDRLAYSWYLEQALQSPLLGALGNVSAAPWATYGTKDQQGQSLDCLGAVRLENSDGLAGPYHVSTGDDTFALYLATTEDPGSGSGWTTRPEPGRPLFDRASMGKLYSAFDGFLLLFEKNDQESGPCVAAAYFESWEHLANGTVAAYFQSTRTLDGPAEGTPNLLRAPEGDSIFDSTLTIGLHFYKDGSVDQQAVAVLEDFGKSWTTMPLTTVNEWVLADGYQGKVGARETFQLEATGTQVWAALEAQETLDAWDSWRILVGDGLGYIAANIKTSGGSSSLANPSVRSSTLNTNGNARGRTHKGFRSGQASATRDSAGPLVVTLFVPSEGSAPGESGELVYPA